MNHYSFGKPEPARPIASAGYWHDETCVLSMQTRIKLVVRPPVGVPALDEDISADQFEEGFRQVVADTLLGLEEQGFTVVGAMVEEFEDAGG